MTDSGRNATLDFSPRTLGIVWLTYFVVGIPALSILRRLVVKGDAAATAHNILAHSVLFQVSASIDFVGNAIYIVLTVLLYKLLRPVNRTLALTAAVFSLMGCIVQIMAGLLRVSAPFILANPDLASAFSVQQVQAATLFGLGIYSRAFLISFPLFALFEMVTAYLILRSSFLPRWLGVWWALAGASWLIFLWPPFATSVQGFIIAIAGPAELAFALWLIVKSAEIERAVAA